MLVTLSDDRKTIRFRTFRWIDPATLWKTVVNASKMTTLKLLGNKTLIGPGKQK